jgi:hypothetical protein
VVPFASLLQVALRLILAVTWLYCEYLPSRWPESTSKTQVRPAAALCKAERA